MEFKFRGKKITLGHDEWVFGNGAYIGNKNAYIFANEKITGVIPVHENTVGQYAGVRDSNGKDIYVGDILEIGKYVSDEEKDKERKKELAIVIQREGGFYAEDLESGERLRIPRIKYKYVAGNIHDNHDLLEKHKEPI